VAIPHREHPVVGQASIAKATFGWKKAHAAGTSVSVMPTERVGVAPPAGAGIK